LKATKEQFRQAAVRVYEMNGAIVTRERVKGAPPYSRVKITVGSETRSTAIRTTRDRELAVTRHPDGRIAILSKVDEVAAVCPALDMPGHLEVLAFDKNVVLEAAEHAFARQRERYPDVSPKSPVFISLDEPEGLGGKVRWRKVVPITAPMQEAPSMAEFRDRVHRDFAALQGLPLEEVSVEFRILTPARQRV
jgi:hypothetical protein